MPFSRVATALIFLSASPALALETATAELRYGTLPGDPRDFTASRVFGETAFDMGPWGLQFGIALAHLTDADENTARAIYFRDLGAHVRLGLSAALASFDGAETDSVLYSLHALWTAPGARIDAAIVLPDHIDDTGAFSYDISGTQDLTSRLAVTTDLHRLTTDLEVDDFWSISLGVRYALDDRLTLTAAGIRSTADDYNFDNRLARLGLDWSLSDRTTASATLMHLVADDDSTRTGLELRLRRDIGPAADRSRMFDAGPLTDRFAIGAFEP